VNEYYRHFIISEDLFCAEWEKEKEEAGVLRSEPTGRSDSSPFRLKPKGLPGGGTRERELPKPGFHYGWGALTKRRIWDKNASFK
jgi:hypothetical protein